jgi:hypothetical protein
MTKPPQPAGHDLVAVNGGLSIVAEVGVALHVHEIDRATLSPECS